MTSSRSRSVLMADLGVIVRLVHHMICSLRALNENHQYMFVYFVSYTFADCPTRQQDGRTIGYRNVVHAICPVQSISGPPSLPPGHRGVQYMQQTVSIKTSSSWIADNASIIHSNDILHAPLMPTSAAFSKCRFSDAGNWLFRKDFRK